jgi:hypothetical protein
MSASKRATRTLLDFQEVVDSHLCRGFDREARREQLIQQSRTTIHDSVSKAN